MNSINKHFLAATIVLLTPAVSFALNHNGNVKLGADPQIAELTDGYNTQTQQYLYTGGQLCLQPGAIQYLGNSSNYISLTNGTAFSSVKNSLDIDVSAHLSIGSFLSLSADAKFAHDIQSDAYSQSFYYMENIILPSRSYQPSQYGAAALSAFGKAAFDSTDETQFVESCGNDFVQQQQLGANLYLALKLQFNSHQDKKTFELAAKGGLGSLFSATTNIKNIVQTSKVKGNLYLYLYQKGGDVSQLPSAFKKDPDKGYYNLHCSLDDLDSCNKAIDSFIDYGKDDFSKQVGFSNGAPTGKPAVLKNIVQPYATIGIIKNAKPLSAEIMNARLYLAAEDEAVNKKIAFFNHVLTSAMMSNAISYDTKQSVHDSLSKLNEDKKALESDAINHGAIACYSDPDSCVAVKAALQAKMHDNDPAVNNLYNGLNTTYFASGFIFDTAVSGPAFNLFASESLYFPTSIDLASGIPTTYNMFSSNILTADPVSLIRYDVVNDSMTFSGPDSNSSYVVKAPISLSDVLAINGASLVKGNGLYLADINLGGHWNYNFLLRPIETPL